MLRQDQVHVLIEEYLKHVKENHKKLPALDTLLTGNLTYLNDAITFLSNQSGEYLNLAAIASNDKSTQKLHENQKRIFFKLLDETLLIEATAKQLKINGFDKHSAALKWLEEKPKLDLKEIHADVKNLGIGEKFLSGKLHGQEWLTEVDLNRLVDILGLKDRVTVTRLTVEDIGMILHFHREKNKDSDEPYEIPLLLNRGSRGNVGSQGVHWAETVIKVDPKNKKIVVTFKDSMPLSSIAKEEIKKTILNALRYKEVSRVGEHVKIYQAFPGNEYKIDIDVTAEVGEHSQKDGWSCGFRALKNLVDEPNFDTSKEEEHHPALQQFKQIKKEGVTSEKLRDFVYNELLSAVEVPNEQLQKYGEMDFPREPFQEKSRINEEYLKGFIKYIAKVKPNRTPIHSTSSELKELLEIESKAEEFYPKYLELIEKEAKDGLLVLDLAAAEKELFDATDDAITRKGKIKALIKAINEKPVLYLHFKNLDAVKETAYFATEVNRITEVVDFYTGELDHSITKELKVIAARNNLIKLCGIEIDKEDNIWLQLWNELVGNGELKHDKLYLLKTLALYSEAQDLKRFIPNPRYFNQENGQLEEVTEGIKFNEYFDDLVKQMQSKYLAELLHFLNENRLFFELRDTGFPYDTLRIGQSFSGNPIRDFRSLQKKIVDTRDKLDEESKKQPQTQETLENINKYQEEIEKYLKKEEQQRNTSFLQSQAFDKINDEYLDCLVNTLTNLKDEIEVKAAYFPFKQLDLYLNNFSEKHFAKLLKLFECLTNYPGVASVTLHLRDMTLSKIDLSVEQYEKLTELAQNQKIKFNISVNMDYIELVNEDVNDKKSLLSNEIGKNQRDAIKNLPKPGLHEESKKSKQSENEKVKVRPYKLGNYNFRKDLSVELNMEQAVEKQQQYQLETALEQEIKEEMHVDQRQQNEILDASAYSGVSPISKDAYLSDESYKNALLLSAPQQGCADFAPLIVEYMAMEGNPFWEMSIGSSTLPMSITEVTPSALSAMHALPQHFLFGVSIDNLPTGFFISQGLNGLVLCYDNTKYVENKNISPLTLKLTPKLDERFQKWLGDLKTFLPNATIPPFTKNEIATFDGIYTENGKEIIFENITIEKLKKFLLGQDPRSDKQIMSQHVWCLTKNEETPPALFTTGQNIYALIDILYSKGPETLKLFLNSLKKLYEKDPELYLHFKTHFLMDGMTSFRSAVTEESLETLQKLLTLTAPDKVGERAWWMELVQQHKRFNTQYDLVDLYNGFEMFCKNMPEGIELPAPCPIHDCNNMLVGLDRLLGILSRVPRGIPNQLNDLEGLSLDPEGAWYAARWDGFHYFHRAMALTPNAFNTRFENSLGKDKISYAINYEHMLKMSEFNENDWELYAKDISDPVKKLKNNMAKVQDILEGKNSIKNFKESNVYLEGEIEKIKNSKKQKDIAQLQEYKKELKQQQIRLAEREKQLSALTQNIAKLRAQVYYPITLFHRFVGGAERINSNYQYYVNLTDNLQERHFPNSINAKLLALLAVATTGERGSQSLDSAPLFDYIAQQLADPNLEKTLGNLIVDIAKWSSKPNLDELTAFIKLLQGSELKENFLPRFKLDSLSAETLQDLFKAFVAWSRNKNHWTTDFFCGFITKFDESDNQNREQLGQLAKIAAFINVPAASREEEEKKREIFIEAIAAIKKTNPKNYELILQTLGAIDIEKTLPEHLPKIDKLINTLDKLKEIQDPTLILTTITTELPNCQFNVARNLSAVVSADLSAGLYQKIGLLNEQLEMVNVKPIDMKRLEKDPASEVQLKWNQVDNNALGYSLEVVEKLPKILEKNRLYLYIDDEAIKFAALTPTATAEFTTVVQDITEMLGGHKEEIFILFKNRSELREKDLRAIWHIAREQGFPQKNAKLAFGWTALGGKGRKLGYSKLSEGLEGLMLARLAILIEKFPPLKFLQGPEFYPQPKKFFSGKPEKIGEEFVALNNYSEEMNLLFRTITDLRLKWGKEFNLDFILNSPMARQLTRNQLRGVLEKIKDLPINYIPKRLLENIFIRQPLPIGITAETYIERVSDILNMHQFSLEQRTHLIEVVSKSPGRDIAKQLVDCLNQVKNTCPAALGPCFHIINAYMDEQKDTVAAGQAGSKAIGEITNLLLLIEHEKENQNEMRDIVQAVLNGTADHLSAFKLLVTELQKIEDPQIRKQYLKILTYSCLENKEEVDKKMEAIFGLKSGNGIIQNLRELALSPPNVEEFNKLYSVYGNKPFPKLSQLQRYFNLKQSDVAKLQAELESPIPQGRAEKKKREERTQRIEALANVIKTEGHLTQTSLQQIAKIAKSGKLDANKIAVLNSISLEEMREKNHKATVFFADFDKDPFGHRKNPKTLAAQFDMSTAAQRIDSIRDLTRNGERLFYSQRQKLFDQMTYINDVGKDFPLSIPGKPKHFEVTNEYRKPVMELTKSQIRELVQHYRDVISGKSGATKQEKELAQLEYIAVMREAMYRTTGMFPYPVQIISLLNVLLHGGNVLAEIRTGEGKTGITATFAAAKWVEGRPGEVFSASMELASRDLTEVADFYEYMGIKTTLLSSTPYFDGKTGTVVPKSKFTDYIQTNSEHKDDGIHYTDFDQFALFLEEMQLQHRAMPNQAFCIMDEGDDLTLNKTTQFKFATSLDPNFQEHVNPNEWVYPIILEFVNRKEFMDKKCDKLQDIEDLLDFAFKHSKLTRSQKAAFAKFSITQLDTWIDSAYTASQLVLNQDFAIREATLTINGQKTAVQVAKVKIKGRVSEGSSFSNGVHQFLHTRLNMAIDAGTIRGHKFIIEPEKTYLASKSAKNIIDYYKLRGDVLALTGTAGSDEEIAELKENYRLKCYKMPPRMQLRRVDHGPDLARRDRKGFLWLEKETAQEAHHRKIYEYIKKCIETRQPALVLCDGVASSKALHEYLMSKLTEEQKKNLLLYNGEQFKEDGTKVTEGEIEKEAGFAGMITISTELLGRGTNIKPSYRNGDPLEEGLFVIDAYIAQDRDYGQKIGRAGRNGARGDSVLVVSEEEFTRRGMPIPKDEDLEKSVKIVQAMLNKQNYKERTQKQLFADEKDKYFTKFIDISEDINDIIQEKLPENYLPVWENIEREMRLKWERFLNKMDNKWNDLLIDYQNELKQKEPPLTDEQEEKLLREKVSALVEDANKSWYELTVSKLNNPDLKNTDLMDSMIEIANKLLTEAIENARKGEENEEEKTEDINLYNPKEPFKVIAFDPSEIKEENWAEIPTEIHYEPLNPDLQNPAKVYVEMSHTTDPNYLKLALTSEVTLLFNRLFGKDSIETIYKKLFGTNLEADAIKTEDDKLKIQFKVCLQQLLNNFHKANTVEMANAIDNLMKTIRQFGGGKSLEDEALNLFIAHINQHGDEPNYVKKVTKQLFTMREKGILAQDVDLTRAKLYQSEDQSWKSLLAYANKQLDRYNSIFNSEKKENVRLLREKIDAINDDLSVSDKIQALIDIIDTVAKDRQDQDYKHANALKKWSLSSFRHDWNLFSSKGEYTDAFHSTINRIRDKATSYTLTEKVNKLEHVKKEVTYVKNMLNHLFNLANTDKLKDREEIKDLLKDKELKAWISNIDEANIPESKKYIVLVQERLFSYIPDIRQLQDRVIWGAESTKTFFDYFMKVDRELRNFQLTQEQAEMAKAHGVAEAVQPVLEPQNDSVYNTGDKSLRATIQHSLQGLLINNQVLKKHIDLSRYPKLLDESNVESSKKNKETNLLIQSALFEIERSFKRAFTDAVIVSFDVSFDKDGKLSLKVDWFNSGNNGRTTDISISGLDRKGPLVCTWPETKQNNMLQMPQKTNYRKVH